MSTVAYRDGVIAADGGACVGDTRIGQVSKITSSQGVFVAGAVGSSTWASKFLSWAQKSGGLPREDAPAMKTEQSGHGVVVYAEGAIYLFDYEGCVMVDAPYVALGSGREAALGAMHHGATASEAVRAAMSVDINTFGDIDRLKV